MIKTEHKAALFTATLVAVLIALTAYVLSHWDGCLGYERKANGGVDVLCLGSPAR
jgi:hypothetical protein